MNTADTIAEIQHLTDQDCDLTQIARALHRQPDSITRLLARHGRHDLIQRLTRRTAA